MLSLLKITCLIGGFLVLLSAAAPVNGKSALVCGAAGVSVRLPLSGLRNSNDGKMSWETPPRAFYFKPWNMVYASHAANHAVRNFQFDPSLIDNHDPTGDMNDLSSFQLPNNDKVFTSYGIDSPIDQSIDHLQYSGTGILKGAFSTYSLLAWGCDENRLPYYVNFATETKFTNTPAGIDIMSASDKGVDDQTFGAIKAALTGLGNEVVAAMAANLTRTMQDGARNGQPRITTCDAYCKSNENLKGILGF